MHTIIKLQATFHLPIFFHIDRTIVIIVLNSRPIIYMVAIVANAAHIRIRTTGQAFVLRCINLCARCAVSSIVYGGF